MVGPGHSEIVMMTYHGGQFRLAVVEHTEAVLRGTFQWTGAERIQFLALQQHEDEAQPWYLDDDGYRLSDERLFQASPWAVVDGEVCTKVVQRFMNCDTGEAWFCLTPWVRIGDEFNRPLSE